MADSRQNRQNSSSSSSVANSAKATRQIASAARATPDEVLRLLETCQLSEQDADDLLKDAYALNRLLRAHLAHVESPQERSSSQPRHHGDQLETGSPDDGTTAGGAGASSSGSTKGFGRQQLSGPERRQQSSSRRSVSLSGRSSVSSLTSAGSSQQQAQRLPPIRTCSPGQRLSEMARVYNSGVIQPAHRAGSGNTSAAAAATSTSKKRL